MSPEINSLSAKSRKDRRKQERSKNTQQQKKKQPTTKASGDPRRHRKRIKDEEKDRSTSAKSSNKKAKTEKRSSKNKDDDPYAHLDPATAAALRQDDAEIAELERKMGLASGSTKEKSRLKKEYAKLECYGDDFTDFLDDVDDMVLRVVTSSSGNNHEADGDNDDDDDQEQEEYRVRLLAMQEQEDSDDGANFPLNYFNEDDFEDEPDEEILPMKDGAAHDEYDGMLLVGGGNEDDHSSDSENADEKEQPPLPSSEEDEEHEKANRDDNERPTDKEMESQSDNDEVDNDDHSQSEDDKTDEEDDPTGDANKTLADREKESTYRPSRGEDIYGNPIDKDASSPAPKKYVPPHLRKQQQQQSPQHDEKEKEEDEARRRNIQRLLNNALNRLSEDTLISVVQQVAEVYPSNPTSIVNECLWKNLQIACIDRPHLMTGLIPVYVACIAGVHIQMGERAQVGEYILEMTVTDLWQEVEKASDNSIHKVLDEEEGPIVSKDASNLMLVLCYLYNYGIVHCSLLYSVVRRFIENFREIEVELLMIILSHCGRALRSDDPSALKEIVLLVQKRALEVTKVSNASLSSRVEYMVSAMMDLKNNKRRQKDSAYEDKVAKIRKLLGRIKSSVASAFGSSDAPSLRIGLDDILNVASKGRWWKVGAKWVGNQYRFAEDGDSGVKAKASGDKDSEQLASDAKEDKKLLKLAAKARMNTDAKRAIFCIIMKGADFEDAFEKLTRAGYLKNRKERDTVRVLMECCGNEKSYNPFYAHLASRMCEFQPQCKFSMQLAYWDVFKQFDDKSFSIRKAANLAKLLFHLVIVDPAIKLGVLKALDMASPEDLSEPAVIFLTIFFSNVLEYFEDASDSKRFFEGEVRKGGRGSKKSEFDPTHLNSGFGDEDTGHMEDDEGLGPSLSIFLLQTMKSSPKYRKGSKFRSNLKAAVKACDTEDFF